MSANALVVSCIECRDGRWHKGWVRCTYCGAGFEPPSDAITLAKLKVLLERWLEETKNDWTTAKRLDLIRDTRKEIDLIDMRKRI